MIFCGKLVGRFAFVRARASDAVVWARQIAASTRKLRSPEEPDESHGSPPALHDNRFGQQIEVTGGEEILAAQYKGARPAIGRG